MTYFAILFVLLLIVGSGLVWIGERHSRHLKRLRLFVHGALGKAHFTPALSYFSDAVDAGLAIDEDRRRVCLWQLVTPTEAIERETPKRSGIPNGAGDLFAGLFLGYVLDGRSSGTALDASLASLGRVLAASTGGDVLQLAALNQHPHQ